MTRAAASRSARKPARKADAVPFSPVKMLMGYQREVFNDENQFVAWCASRQIGKSFTGAGRALKTAVMNPRSDFLIAAPSERQSLEALRKVKTWIKAVNLAVAGEEETRDAPGALLTSSIVTLPNGSRIIAVPGKPETVRGFSASVWLDEFAFFEDPAETWKAILPTISSKFGPRKSILITSTPNGLSGRGSRFYEIVKGKERAHWSVHETPITEAAKETGADVEALRAAIADDDAWEQEYLCRFNDGRGVLLSYEMLAAAESDDCTASAPAGFWEPGPRRRIFCGIDFGRIGDPSVCWTFEQIGEILYTREVLVLRDMTTPDQEAALQARVKAAERVSVDYTGPGIGLGDYLARSFGEWNPDAHKFGKVELCTFSQQFKAALFPALRRAFDAPIRVRIPRNVDVREDLHEMEQVVTRSGGYTYTAKRTEAGHSDRCVACALALRAADAVPTNAAAPIDLSAMIFPTFSASQDERAVFF